MDSEFTDAAAAIDEAEWLAEQTGVPHGLFAVGDFIVVLPLEKPRGRILEIVRPSMPK
jgi:hypothetical protein